MKKEDKEEIWEQIKDDYIDTFFFDEPTPCPPGEIWEYLRSSFYGDKYPDDLTFWVDVLFDDPDSEEMKEWLLAYFGKCCRDKNYQGLADMAEVMRRRKENDAVYRARYQSCQAYVAACDQSPPQKITFIKYLVSEYDVTEEAARKRADEFEKEFFLFSKPRGRPPKK